MAEEKKEEGAAEEAAPKKGKKKIVIIAVVLLVLVLGGASFALMGGKKKEGGEDGAAQEEHHEEVHLQLAKMDTFIVNLSENTSFLKVAMLLEYDPSLLVTDKGEGGEGGGHGGGGSGGGEQAAGPGPLPAQIAPREPMIRDAVLRVLSSKKATELLVSDGKEKLKEELIDAINDAIGLPEGPVVNIYFTEFLIQ